MKRISSGKYSGTFQGVAYIVKKAGFKDWRLYFDAPLSYQVSSQSRKGLIAYLQQLEGETASV